MFIKVKKKRNKLYYIMHTKNMQNTKHGKKLQDYHLDNALMYNYKLYTNIYSYFWVIF